MILAVVLATSCLFGGDAPPELAAALDRAGANRPEIERAIDGVAEDERDAQRWLIARMPLGDLRSLSAKFLIDNCAQAHRAWHDAAWHAAVPREVFLDAILPYASVDERREEWRSGFRERFAALVADAKDPGEAAAILNRSIFAALGVRYSKERKKAAQSPSESIESGIATCTGLSILLIDACRSVAVPARFVGTPQWADGSGNHSWVEVWRDGWHFTGAAEPSGMELDRGWFAGRAAQATPGDPWHAIFAVTWNDSSITFPMVWSPQDASVRAIDVTERYAKKAGDDPVAALGSFLASHALAEVEAAAFAAAPLTKARAEAARAILRKKQVEEIRAELASEFEARELAAAGKKLKFWFQVYGEKPESGRSLFLSMHGGGSAPAAVNDQQWENQKRLYRPAEGVYVAPRAPTDTWNLWHEPHVDALFDRLIEAMIVFEDVDPDRVYLLGYSAGGDGVYQLAPRMADRFAAAAMMAGHPNEARPDGLCDLPFAIHVGANDGAYSRNKVAADWGAKLDELAKPDPTHYVHLLELHAGKGHWMDREDASAIPWLAQYRRPARPAKVVWVQDDVVHDRFYWLAVAEPRAGDRVVVERDGQTIRIDASTTVSALTIRLDDSMLDLDREVVVEWGGKEVFRGKPERTIRTLARTLRERGDPTGAYDAEIAVKAP